MGFILFLLAFTLVVLITPLGLLFTLFRFDLKRLNDYYMNLAISLDQFGNVAMGSFFNSILTTDNRPHLFGDPDETISSVLGKNKLNNSLSTLGNTLDSILNSLDDNHSINSIEDGE